MSAFVFAKAIVSYWFKLSSVIYAMGASATCFQTTVVIDRISDLGHYDYHRKCIKC